jgi:hypothetical protein
VQGKEPKKIKNCAIMGVKNNTEYDNDKKSASSMEIHCSDS